VTAAAHPGPVDDCDHHKQNPLFQPRFDDIIEIFKRYDCQFFSLGDRCVPAASTMLLDARPVCCS